MKEIKGDLETVDIQNGSCQVWLKIKDNDNRICLFVEKDTVISINNEPVSLGKFLQTVTTQLLTGTIYPLLNRYGAALTAEFFIKDN